MFFFFLFFSFYSFFSGRIVWSISDFSNCPFEDQNIRLSREELGEFSGMSGLVEFADKSGYYATLSAYHSLHCIKRLHHYLYFDQYYPGKTELEAMLIKHHAGKLNVFITNVDVYKLLKLTGGAEHCLNILLQTVQCNPDLSIFPMQWGARYVSHAALSYL